jgi:hypothetical protein
LIKNIVSINYTSEKDKSSRERMRRPQMAAADLNMKGSEEELYA